MIHGLVVAHPVRRAARSPIRGPVASLALAVLVLASCVGNRPSRNGVFDENQYIRKAFLTTDGTHPDPGWFLKATVTQVSTPNPLGALGVFPGADTGFGTGLGYVRFVITSDKLQMVNVRQISSVASPDNTPEVINAWPITNVDLKYQVNLDGETTNFYQENQELDWQVRQWVKINLDKNDMSDAAPLGYFVTGALEKCTDISNASATLVPNSFTTEEQDDWRQDYMSWQVQISAPLNFGDAACAEAFAQGASGLSSQSFGRNYVTFTLMYSLMRVKDVEDPSTNSTAYVPLVLDEKDPIRHKYGLFEIIPVDRDTNSNLLAARELVTRWNPLKPVTYYFASDVPYNVKDAFLGHRTYDSTSDQALDVNLDCSTKGCARAPDGIKDLTNNLMQKAGNKTFSVDFLDWNDEARFGDAQGPNRQYGDVRYNFIHYVPDIDANTGWLGYGPSASDPRTGEILNATVNIADSEATALAYQIDFFLQSLGVSQGLSYAPGGAPSEWPPAPPGLSGGSCTPGQTVQLNGSVVASSHNGSSSLFQDIQQYMGKPAATYGNLGPGDFIPTQDQDFFTAYYTLIPYAIYADPSANAFVIPEGGAGINGPANFWDLMANEVQFHAVAAQIDHGITPFEGVTGDQGIQNATAFINNFRSLTQNHIDLQYAKQFIHRQQVYDPVNAMSLVQIADHAARHCIADPGGGTHWETKEEWATNLVNSFYEQIAIHEFGHTLGLEHNFMGSIDQPNFPVKTDASGNAITDVNGNPEYTLYTNSVMEYTARMGDVFDVLQWGPYDQAALAWTYTNDAPKPVDPALPAAKSITGQIDAKTPWNDPLGFQADGKTEIMFMSCHDGQVRYTPLCRQFDMGATPSEIMANQVEQYDWLWNFNNFRVYRKFWDDSAYADKPAGLMQDMRRFLLLWIYDWNSGSITDTLRRIGFQTPPNVPAAQYYSQLENKFNLELSTANQLMATFHKAVIQQSTGQRPVATIYDQFYGDVTQQGIILDKLFAMEYFVGLWPSSSLYDQNQAGAYFTSYGIAAGLDPSYETVAEDAVDSMVGGQYDAFPYFAPLAVALFAQDTHSPNFSGRVEVRNWIGGHVFSRVDDFVNYFRDLAAQNNYPGCSVYNSPTCTYDPRTIPDPTGHNEFFGPDHSEWIWAYIPDRNEYVAVQKEVNVVSYVIVRNYNNDLVNQLDDGSQPGAAYPDELQMKYYLDAFTYYN